MTTYSRGSGAPKAKYIRFTSLGQAFDACIIFPVGVSHYDMAMLLCGEPASAGFVDVEDNDAYASGESVTLGLKANIDEDSKLLTKMLVGR